MRSRPFVVCFGMVGAAAAVNTTALTAQAQEVVARVLEDAVSKKALVASRAARSPSPARPFVFFHQRKTGGTAMRHLLVNSAKRHHLPYHVKCFNNVQCNAYDLPLNEPLSAVYGGHIYFPSALKAIEQAHVRHPSFEAPFETATEDVGFDCFTIFRDPVSRVASCWNYRFPNAPPFQTIDADFVKNHLPTAMSIFAEGCNNEPLRILSDSGRAEEKVNTLTATDDAITAHPGTDWALDAVGTLARTLEHMDMCVVGVVERCDETRRVVRHYFPWFVDFRCDIKERVSKRSSHPESFRPDVIAEVKRQNALEVLAYEAANSMLDAQLAAIPLSTTQPGHETGSEPTRGPPS